MKTYEFKKSLVALLAALGLMLQPVLPAMAQENTPNPSIDVSKVRVPEVYGSVKETHKGNDKVVFYLQDAHCNFEAQQNNARILQDLVNQYGIDTVAVEGTSGKIETADLAAFPDKEAMADVASYFMSQGRITGPEYLAITGEKPFSLYGLEDKAVYDKNKEAFVQTVSVQKDAAAQINAVNETLAKMAEKMFPADLKAFHDAVTDYRAGKIKFTEYAQKMRDAAAKHGVDISAFKNFDKQGKSFDMEGKIDFDAVEDERAAIVDELSKKLSKEDTSNLVVQSLSFRLGRMGAVEYYDILKGYCDKAGVDIKSKANLSQYIDYIKLFEDINKDALVDEASAIEDAVKSKLFTGDDQRKLDAMMHHMGKVAKMLDIKLGIRDYKTYAKSAGENSPAKVMDFINAKAPAVGVTAPAMDIASLERNIAAVENFYSIATDRDEVLAKNAIAMMKDMKLDRMAMVTGGFHTGAIADKLKGEGYSVVVITPRITDFDAKSPYVDVMMGKQTPMEKVLASGSADAQTLAPETALNNAKAKKTITSMAGLVSAIRQEKMTEEKRAQLEKDLQAALGNDTLRVKIPANRTIVIASENPANAGKPDAEKTAGVLVVLTPTGVAPDLDVLGLKDAKVLGTQSAAEAGGFTMDAQFIQVDGARKLYKDVFLNEQIMPSVPPIGAPPVWMGGISADRYRELIESGSYNYIVSGLQDGLNSGALPAVVESQVLGFLAQNPEYLPYYVVALTQLDQTLRDDVVKIATDYAADATKTAPERDAARKLAAVMNHAKAIAKAVTDTASTTARIDVAKGEVTMDKGPAIAVPAEVADASKASEVTGFTFATGAAASEVAVAKAIAELMEHQILQKVDRSVDVLSKNTAVQALPSDKKVKLIAVDVDNIFSADDVAGQPTNIVINYAELAKALGAMKDSGVDILAYSGKWSAKQIESLFKTAAGVDLKSYPNVQALNIGDADALMRQVDGMIAAKKLAADQVRFILRQGAAHHDAIKAAVDGKFKYLVGQDGVTFDQLLTLAIASNLDAAELEKLMVEAGVSAVEAKEMVAAITADGHLVPPSMETKSVLQNLNVNPRSFEVSA